MKPLLFTLETGIKMVVFDHNVSIVTYDDDDDAVIRKWFFDIRDDGLYIVPNEPFITERCNIMGVDDLCSLLKS